MEAQQILKYKLNSISSGLRISRFYKWLLPLFICFALFCSLYYSPGCPEIHNLPASVSRVLPQHSQFPFLKRQNNKELARKSMSQSINVPHLPCERCLPPEPIGEKGTASLRLDTYQACVESLLSGSVLTRLEQKNHCPLWFLGSMPPPSWQQL